MSKWFNTKGSGFRCNYGFVNEVLTLRVASGILPAMFLVSSSDALSFYICSLSKAEKVKFSE